MAGEPAQASDETDWDATSYARNAAYVGELAADLVDLLDPKAGETIIDLGCGDGALSLKLAERGARVIGLDASAAMVAHARSRGIEARVADAADFSLDAPADALFSNATLHWVPRAREAAACMQAALRPGGRLVAEFGGLGNVAQVVAALEAELTARSINPAGLNPWFFPDADTYSALLEEAGFTVKAIRLFDRPTRVEMGIEAWLRLFAPAFLKPLKPVDHEPFIAAVAERLAPGLQDSAGIWWVDHVRLRVQAVRS